MKSIFLMPIIFLASVAFAETVNFDDAKQGQIPKGWLAGVTGEGHVRWVVEFDTTAQSKPNVLKQSGEGTFPWCVKKNTSMDNGFVEVKFRPISGKEDQAGGLIWRWKDGNNYYVTRANALEDNVTIYRTIDGKRRAFNNTNIKVTSNEWHVLRVDFHGNHFIVTFDTKQVIEAYNDEIQGWGAVGVWTKADSVTEFDDFTYGNQ